MGLWTEGLTNMVFIHKPLDRERHVSRSSVGFKALKLSSPSREMRGLHFTTFASLNCLLHLPSSSSFSSSSFFFDSLSLRSDPLTSSLYSTITPSSHGKWDEQAASASYGSRSPTLRLSSACCSYQVCLLQPPLSCSYDSYLQISMPGHF